MYIKSVKLFFPKYMNSKCKTVINFTYNYYFCGKISILFLRSKIQKLGSWMKYIYISLQFSCLLSFRDYNFQISENLFFFPVRNVVKTLCLVWSHFQLRLAYLFTVNSIYRMFIIINGWSCQLLIVSSIYRIVSFMHSLFLQKKAWLRAG